MPTIQDLRARHPSIDTGARASRQALYEGGKKFERLLGEFLPQRQAEPDGRYAIRRKEHVYRNYLGPVIDYFAALLFTSSPRAVAKTKDAVTSGDATKSVVELDEFYARFREDADRNGSDLDAIMKDRLTEALIHGASWIVLEKRDDGGSPAENLADYEKRKLGDCWLRPVRESDGVSVLDWETDELGLIWAIVHTKTAKRLGLSGGRSIVTERWELFTRDEVHVFSIRYKDDQPPAETTDVKVEGSRRHGFDRVPIVCLEVPVGLCVALRLETPQLAHFRLSNAQMWGLTQTCYSMPVFKMDVDSSGKHRMPTMGAGYGIVIGKDESVSWEAPPSSPYESLSSEIKSHKDEIYRIAHQMALGVENNAAAVGRSADSKHQDAQSTKVVLLAYSRLVKECIEYMYDLISSARGESHQWSIEGLDDFAAVDLSGLVDVLDQVQQAGGIPSRTFNIAMKQRLAEALLPDMDQAMKEKVRKEIEAGVDQKTEDDAKALALGHAHLKAAGFGKTDDNGDDDPPVPN